MRYFIYLRYDGANYHGWQVQPNASSIQAEMNRAVSIINGRETEVVGAGRTDTGVNASMMVAHFDADRELDANVAEKLNRILPQDIGVYRVVRVRDDAHARFSALSRTYQYHIHFDRNPFNRQYSFHIPYPLDIDKMNQAAQRLMDYTDFTSFSKLHTDVKTNNCHITHAHWEPSPSTLLAATSLLPATSSPNPATFTITADRFLRNMVRAIVGTLIDVGRGQISVDEFCHIIERKDRCSAGMSVPGEALFLTDITYPDDCFIEGSR